MSIYEKSRIIRGWSDEKLAAELRQPDRLTIPDTYLPLIAEALARVLTRKTEATADALDPKQVLDSVLLSRQLGYRDGHLEARQRKADEGRTGNKRDEDFGG